MSLIFEELYYMLQNPASKDQLKWAIMMIQNKLHGYNKDQKIEYWLWLEKNASSSKQANFARTKYLSIRNN